MISRASLFARAVFFALASTGMAACPCQAADCDGKPDSVLAQLLQPPSCETCDETKGEVAELLELEKSRTSAQEEEANADVERSVRRFLDGVGLNFDAFKLMQCEGFFLRRRQEEKIVVDAAKSAFCRPRPFKTAGNTLHPVEGSKPDDSYSYPSGHATYGASVGFLLAEMLPEKRAAIYARINSYAHSRMIAGVHFRSDVEAGKLLGAALGASLFAKPDFQVEFDEAKTCVRQAAGL